MGKSKSSKRTKRSHNNTAGSSNSARRTADEVIDPDSNNNSISTAATTWMHRREQQVHATITSLEQDLVSLDDKKRESACIVLSDLYAFNISNRLPLEAMTSSSLVNKLSMRLGDCSERVKLKAYEAVRLLSECCDSIIILRLIQTGILRTVIVQSLELINYHGSSSHQPAFIESSIVKLESLLPVISNCMHTCPQDTIREVLHVDGLYLRVVARLIDLSVPARIIDCCIHLLITVSAHDPLLITPLQQQLQLQSMDGCSIRNSNSNEVDCSLLKELWSFVDSMGLLRRPGPDVEELLPRLGLFQSKGLSQDTSSSMLTTIDVLSVQCLELLSTIFLHSSSSSALHPSQHDTVLQMCQIDRIISLQCDLMSIRSTELMNGMLSINAAIKHVDVDVVNQSLQQQNAIDMHAISDEHETNSATTLASTSDADGGGGDVDGVLLSFSDKISVIKIAVEAISSLMSVREGEPVDVEDNAALDDDDGDDDVDMRSSDVDMTSSDSLSGQLGDRSRLIGIIIIRQQQQQMMITQSLSSSGAISSMLCAVKAMHSYVLTCSQSANPMRVTATVIDALLCMERLLDALSHCCIVASAAVVPVPDPAQSSIILNLLPSVAVLADMLEPMLELVTNTTPTAQQQHQHGGGGGGGSGSSDRSKTSGELYHLDEGVTDLSFRRGLVSGCRSLLQVLLQYCKLAGAGAGSNSGSSSGSVSSGSGSGSSDGSSGSDGSMYRISEEDLKALAILLVRCTTLPHLEVCSTAALCIAALGQGDNSCRDNSPGIGLYPPSLNALLTNALLRRLEQPNAFSLESSVVVEEHDQKKKKKKKGNSQQQEIINTTRDYNNSNNSSSSTSSSSSSRQMNVLVASVRLMDVFLNAVIDLHTSDDPLLLHNYSKLRVHDKLSACGAVFHNKVQQQHQMTSSYSSSPSSSSSSSSSSEAAVMDEAEKDKCSETLENVRAFMDYKSQFTS